LVQARGRHGACRRPFAHDEGHGRGLQPLAHVRTHSRERDALVFGVLTQLQDADEVIHHLTPPAQGGRGGSSTRLIHLRHQPSSLPFHGRLGASLTQERPRLEGLSALDQHAGKIEHRLLSEMRRGQHVREHQRPARTRLPCRHHAAVGIRGAVLCTQLANDVVSTCPARPRLALRSTHDEHVWACIACGETGKDVEVDAFGVGPIDEHDEGASLEPARPPGIRHADRASQLCRGHGHPSAHACVAREVAHQPFRSRGCRIDLNRPRRAMSCRVERFGELAHDLRARAFDEVRPSPLPDLEAPTTPRLDIDQHPVPAQREEWRTLVSSAPAALHERPCRKVDELPVAHQISIEAQLTRPHLDVAPSSPAAAGPA
jgi:hypothetical protein